MFNQVLLFIVELMVDFIHFMLFFSKMVFLQKHLCKCFSSKRILIHCLAILINILRELVILLLSKVIDIKHFLIQIFTNIFIKINFQCSNWREECEFIAFYHPIEQHVFFWSWYFCCFCCFWPIGQRIRLKFWNIVFNWECQVNWWRNWWRKKMFSNTKQILSRRYKVLGIYFKRWNKTRSKKIDILHETFCFKNGVINMTAR